MFKNVASQKIPVFAFDYTTGAPKTGDAGNITAYVSKDYGAVTVLGDTTATEMDSTNAKGWYLFDLTQAETNADALLFTGKSSTANVAIVGGGIMFTTPNRFSTLAIDASGNAASEVKVWNGVTLTGITGAIAELGIADAGTAQSATSTTLQMRAAATFADNACRGMVIAAYGSTQGYWQSRVVNSNVGSTDTLTVDAWTVAPTGTITYELYNTAPASTTATLSVNVASIDSSTAAAQSLKNMLTGVGGVTITATFAGNLTGSTTAVVNPVTVGTNLDKSAYEITVINGVTVQGTGTTLDKWRGS